MRWRVLLFVSLGANLVLATLWISASRGTNPQSSLPSTQAAAGPTPKNNVIVHTRFFSWGEVESADYETYIRNLREIGCPEQTIRDIIIADVNTLYSRRVATELVTPEQQWWRSEPDEVVARLAADKARSLEDERRAMLTRLLGTNWESGDLASLPRPSRPGVVLDGPILGILPAESKQAVQEARIRALDRMQAYVDLRRAQGKPEDPAELARLRQQTRDELARILTPQQLEEYLLRYSQNANSLRTQIGQLQHFNASPEEFRAIFRATDTIEQRIQALEGATDPNMIAERRNLEQQRENAIRQALGSERYGLFARLRDPLYRDAYAQAQEAGTPEAVQMIYDISVASTQQLAFVRADTNLTARQRNVELKRIEFEQARAIAQAMGEQELSADLPYPPGAEPVVETTKPIRAHRHVLSVGETVASVAFRYATSTRDIQALNPDLDLRRLQPGDSILVPLRP